MISMAPTARRTTMVQVAGTAGGVGATTVAALIFAALSQDVLGAPQLYDHAAGELGLRLPEGDDVRLVNPGLGLHDCGAHAAAAVGRLADPHTVLVLVTSRRRPAVLRLTGCSMKSSPVTVPASCAACCLPPSESLVGTGLVRSCGDWATEWVLVA